MRVGSTWVCDLIGRVLRGDLIIHPSNPNDVYYTYILKLDKDQRKIENLIKEREKHTLIKIHGWNPSLIPEDKNNKIIIPTRDLKDSIVSRLFYNRAFPGDVRANQVPNFNYKNDRDFINKYIIKNKEIIKRYIREWKMFNDFSGQGYKIRFEKLKQSPLKQLTNMMNYIGIKCDDESLKESVEWSKIKNRIKHKQRKTNYRFRRKGDIGDWKTYMNPTNIKRIDKWRDVL
jgi:hypothetical protein